MMKASVKFRDDQNPLVRAKIPISVLGLPFLSAVTAGESKELSLRLGTFFESGPSLSVSYRPNDSWNPFALVVKTGIGALGSPISAPMTISTEFSLLGRGNPAFFLRLKPRMGDFSIKKTTGSAIGGLYSPSVFGGKGKPLEPDPETDGEGSVDGGATPMNGVHRPMNGDFSAAEKRNGFPQGFHAGGGIDGLLSGAELNAKSVLPLKHRLQLNFRWGVKFPPEVWGVYGDERRRSLPADFSLKKIPLLVINKISIEQKAAEGNSRGDAPGLPSIADTCQSFSRQLELLQAENGMLRQAVQDLRSEMSSAALPPAPKSDKDKNVEKVMAAAGKKERRKGGKPPDLGAVGPKSAEEEVNEELKKALMSATGSG